MISGISKKVIFFSILFINFIQPSKSAELSKINRVINNRNTKINLSNTSILDISSNSLGNYLDDSNDYVKFLKKRIDPFLVAKAENQQELIIQSDKQSEISDVIYAEGNVSVSYRGKLLKADKLIYDKSNKKIEARGNITFILGNQIFRVSQLEYNFISEKGYLLDVKGVINTNTLIDDISSNFSLSDSKKLENLIDLNNKEVINTPENIQNWFFFTEKMIIDGDKWKSKKAIFSNDLLELKQAKLAINSLEVFPINEKLRFKSSLNYLILDEKVSIPFWLGSRNFDFKKVQPANTWNFGYENLDKDGYFIGRRINSIDINDDFVLDLEPQFLIQRSLKGYTKSFVNKGESITSDRVKRNSSFEDYFALKSQIKGTIKNWDLEIEKNLNSLDINKFSDAFRFNTKLSKEIDLLDSVWKKSFYGVYRERVWNGSLGEAEIYSGYGSELQKENTWITDGIKKSEFLSLGLANITAEALNTKNLVTNLKGNLFYSLDQKFPISIVNPKKKSIDISYQYIPEPISKGLSLNTRLEVSYSFYENGNHQEYLGLGIGPELTFGNFKNKIFDYTRISLLPFYKFDNGKSVFKFDQNYEDLTLNISYDQQLYGPIVLKSFGILNLTNDSNDYGEFIDSKISLNWKKRSYEVGIFYQPHNQAGGISFRLFGFK
ncbi:DUF3769 domain-containing protein [Prochlorococcus marinus XMU1414]|uniref:DUF3769 domain-containing protein n=1 Tax=Prochlorococcus marinus XMU1424 TaxID=2774497 RepID=A0A9D9C0T9_PROMR|nr:DUF3769 domain-containing protein [Prochlorococcus marinus]MBO8227554.1 DUF3769 domain-containing protein [Prochlorococcus marinus XMU1414]MBW3045068.1 hypothetical protein [Prochlorococcus marinus str. MU1414]MCR8532667.1 DUF3769 domain-containing protein [Prochlorococcus marinus XMU1420]MCR8536508.1 DUF3769 domain-containing protein [Prochlorococcus marinus XMU1424]